MKRFLVLDTSYPINSRTEKFCASLEKKFEVHVVAWNRTKLTTSVPSNYHVFSKPSKYGAKLRKLINVPLFFLFFFKVVDKQKPDVVFLSHWDSLFLGTMLKLFKPKIRIVYDCLDIPSSDISLVQNILSKLEHLCVSKADLTIFASRYFVSLYSGNSRYLVFENYPSRKVLNYPPIYPEWYHKAKAVNVDNKPVIAWIGVVRYPSILRNLVDAVAGLDVLVFVFGDGPSLEDMKEYVISKGHSGKVHFWGRYSQDEISLVYELSSIVWAAYPTNDFNARYAISNKFFECSLFERMPIISSRTKMAGGLRNKKSESVLLVNEYDVADISKKIGSVIGKKSRFQKYEPDIFWEDQEARVFDKINEVID